MHHPLLLGSLLLLVACAQRYAAPASAQTSAAPEETFECVKRQMSSLGYKQSSVDVDEHRISGTKIDVEARRADTQFRRLFDRLDVEVAPQADGQTGIQVQARTFAEYTTQRGPTEVEEKASDDVKAAAQKLLEKCRG
jgi:hypothetical protein